MQHDNMYVGDQIIDKLFVFVMLDILLFSSSGNKYDPEIVQGIHWSKPNVSDNGIIKLPLQLC